LTDQLHGDALTVCGRTLRDIASKGEVVDDQIIRLLGSPVYPGAALVALFGNLAPDGAVLKISAASPALLTHSGVAHVFEGHEHLAAQIDDPRLNIQADDILVLRNAGPQGSIGMPELGAIPIPDYLLRQGIRDMVRVSDSRMSGTAYGTIVLHVAPEATAGGPLRLVESGDTVVLDVPNRRLDLRVPTSELAKREGGLVPARPPLTAYQSLYRAYVSQADKGCDFDFSGLTPALT
jgi:dihydroxyacid dehydratase/phosphogluconate dehydratase